MKIPLLFIAMLFTVTITAKVFSQEAQGADMTNISNTQGVPVTMDNPDGTPNSSIQSRSQSPDSSKAHSTFYLVSTGSPIVFPSVPEGYSPIFNSALQGWAILDGASPAGYHFAVKPGGRYLVAIGFYDQRVEPKAHPPGREERFMEIAGRRVDTFLNPAYAGGRVQDIVIDGRVMDRLDPSKGDAQAGMPAPQNAQAAMPAPQEARPFVKVYEARDLNHDGFLQISAMQAKVETGLPGLMNAIWIFEGAKPKEIDPEALARDGKCAVEPLYFVDCGREESMPGHVSYPPLGKKDRTRSLPHLQILAEQNPHWPQPVDPRRVEVRGDLGERIDTYLDRWGYVSRDQKLVAGFLWDCGFEVVGRCFEAIGGLGLVTHRDLDLKPSFEALLEHQDATSKHPGSFVGGSIPRTGQVFGQGKVMAGLINYYELTGDMRALDAASKMGDWLDSFINCGDIAASNYLQEESRFTQDGVVGQIGKGTLEPQALLYLYTRNPKHLETARRIADLNRKYGGVAWMIHGGSYPNEKPECESWHTHANLRTLRGYPWMYQATGDRSYLDDAIAGFDNVLAFSWGTGAPPEGIPWGAPMSGPTSEVCADSDILQLAYVLAHFTGEGRFWDAADRIYYNQIRYDQMHNGDFTWPNRLPGPTRGGDGWFCCGFSGGKALAEAARNLYASSADAVYVNGFMPSSAEIDLSKGTVLIETETDIPLSGKVSFKITPSRLKAFDLNVRIPGWAELQSVRANGQPFAGQAEKGYLKLHREWKKGDAIDIEFALPLRVTLNNSWDATTTAKVSLDGASAVPCTYILVKRGPVVIGQFRTAHGCDPNWAYTGDDPDLFEAEASAGDWFDIMSSAAAPSRTLWSSAISADEVRVKTTDAGIRIEWEATPAPGWRFVKSILVKSAAPSCFEYRTELTAPTKEEADRILAGARFCGVRMRTGGGPDYAKARLLVDGKEMNREGWTLNKTRKATLDNGLVQFHVSSLDCDLVAEDHSEPPYGAIYCAGKRVDENKITAGCSLTISGRSWHKMPMIMPLLHKE